MFFGLEKSRELPTFVIKSEAPQEKEVHWYHDISTGNKLWGRFGKKNSDYFIDIPDIGLAKLDTQRSVIEFYNSKNLDHKQATSFYQHHLLPLALSLQGYTLVHAGAFLLGNQAFLYLGPSGVGKSTLSLQLLKLNQMILGDDSLRIGKFNSEFVVYPGTETLRIQQDLPMELTLNCPIECSYFNKKLISLNEFYKLNDFYSVNSLIFLSPGRKMSIKKMTPHESLPLLLQQIFRLEIEEKTLLKKELEIANDLLSHSPCYQVTWPHNFLKLEENTAKLLDYFRSVLLDKESIQTKGAYHELETT